jgi:hypothetical protein
LIRPFVCFAEKTSRSGAAFRFNGFAAAGAGLCTPLAFGTFFAFVDGADGLGCRFTCWISGDELEELV